MRPPARRRASLFGSSRPRLAASTLGVLAVLAGAVVPLTALTTAVTTTSAAASPAPLCGSGGTPAVTALANPVFYIDTSSGLDATYGGYTVRAGGAAEDQLWLSLSGFTGGVVGLAPSQPSSVALPNLAPNASTTAYALLRASAPTTTPQTHTIRLFRGHPTSGQEVCSRTFTYNSVAETIKALANKVTGVTADVPATAEIGDVVNVTVTGNTGTLGAGPANDPGVLSYAPAALSSFPAGSWRLERTQMTISPDGTAPQQTYVDRLFLSGASGPNRPYTAIYRFRAIGPAASGAPVAPVQYIASGTQVKHTDVNGSINGALPTVSAQGKVVLAKTASPTTTATGGGNVTYTVAIQNVSSTTARLDRLVDTFPASATYVTGSSQLGGVTVPDPDVVSGTATWRGPIDVAAGTTLALTYQLTLPSTAGRYANSVVGHYGNAALDASRDVTVSNPATVEVVVPAASGTANAVDDTATTAANTAVAVAVLTNDTSSLGGALTVTAVGTPSSGTAGIAGTSVLFTPADGFAGQATFTYTLSDGYTTDTATVTVTVTPAANADSYVTGRNATLNGSTVLANDLCTGCTVTQVGSLTGLTLNTNGTFTYVPQNNFTGSVSFTYRVTAPGGLTADAVVTIFVGNAAPDFVTTAYDTNASVAVTANDTCPGSCNFNINSNVLPQYGTTSESGSNAVYNPNTGFVGVDQFSYTGTGSTSATVTVLVGPPAKALSTTFGTPVSGNLSNAAFLGITTVSCASCTWALDGAPSGGTATIAAGGALTYTPGPSFAGADTFTYTITHPASGLSVTGTVNVIVGPSASDDSATTMLGTPVALNLLANDSCPATCTVTVVSPPSSGNLTGSGGSLTYNTSASDEIGDITFTYQVASSVASGAIDTATVTIRVEGADDDIASTDPGQAVTVTVLANDPCTSCTVSAVSTPSVGSATTNGTTVQYTPPASFSGTATFTYTVTKNGRSTTADVVVTVRPDAVDDTAATATGVAVVIDPRVNDLCLGCTVQSVGSATNGSAAVTGSGTAVQFTPSAPGTGSFTYTVVDRAGNTANATVVVTVSAPPNATDDTASTAAGSPVAIDVLANDSCSGCAATVATDPANGTVSVRADGRLQFTPTARFSGTATFTYLATDPATGLGDTALVTVTVSPTSTDDRTSTAPGSPVTTDVLANDSCTSCTLSVTPPGTGSVTISGGSIQFIPAGGFQGQVTIPYTATDPATGLTTSATLVVEVNAATDDATTTPAGTPVTIAVLTNDVNCPGCTITAVGTPSNGTAPVPGSPTGSITYTPGAGFFGLDTFTYTVTDGSVTSTADVRVLVAPPARTVVVDIGGTTSGSLLTGGSCAGCVFSLVSPPAAGEITLNPDGTWTYEAPPSGQPTDTVTYRITDPVSGQSVTATLTVQVRQSSVTVVASVTNDDGGTLNAAGTTLRLNGSTVASGTTTARPAGTTNTVTYDTPAGYSVTGIACADATPSAVAHPVVLAAGAAVTCTVSFNDVANTPELTVTKTAGTPTDPNTNGRIDAGEQVTYTYTVANTGNTTVTGVTITDDKIAGLTSSCVLGTMAPAASVTCTATYTFTQADVDAGAVTNVATATGTAGGAVTDSATVTVTIPRTSGVGATKVVHAQNDLDSDGRIGPGDTIVFRITATNSGNTTLSGVAISDSPDSHTCGTMLPAATCTFDVTRTVSQADVDAGSLANTATASAVGHASMTPFTTDASVTATITAGPPILSVVKALTGLTDADASGTRTVGDTLLYTITLTNTGQRTATGVQLADTVTGDSRSCPDLAPGATCVLSADLLVTGAMALTGSVQNDAQATAGNAATGTAALTTSLVKPVGISITNELLQLDRGQAGPSDRVDAGDRATYRVIVTNTGLGPVTGLAPTSAAGTPDCGGITTLAAGASVTCTVVRTLTQADVDNGTVDAGASVTGTSAGQSLTASAALSTALPAAPGVTLAATASATACPSTAESVTVASGGTVVFCYSVTNSGNVTVSGVRITDPDAGLTAEAQPTVISGSTTLAPGATLVAAAPRSASVARTHTVTAAGAAPGGAPVSATDAVAVAIAPTSRTGVDVTGVVWFDRDRDGTRDTDEPVLPGATVRLQAPTTSDGSLSAAGTIATTVTDRDGAYRFADVGTGRFTIVASASAGGLSPFSDSDGGKDWQVTVTVAAAPVVADFAAAGAGAIGGDVTSRTTGNPIPNTQVSCTWAGLDGVAGTDDDVRFSAVTDASGRYDLDGVPYGSVTCGFTDPATNERTSTPSVVNEGVRAEADAVLGRVGTLPRTGSGPARELTIGVLLLVLGAGLVLGARRFRAPGTAR